jgi:uncharacterized protein (DUF2267 family)
VREEEFLEFVERAAGITRQEAREAVRATLRTLAERITRGEAEDIAVFLPGAFRELLASAGELAEPFDVDEFVRRVARREGVDGRTATRHVRAVFTALAQLASLDALSNLAAQLSNDFEPLLEVGRRSGALGTAQARGAGRPDHSLELPLPMRPAESADENPPTATGETLLQGDVMTTRSTPTPSRRLFAAYRAVDRAFQRLFEVDARLLYGFVVPVLAISGVVVLLAWDPSNWLLALAVVLLLAASLIVVLGIVRMLSDGDATG